jgi:hypothetical protein
VADGLTLALWDGLGLAGRFEALLAWHGRGASNFCAHDRECIRSIAYSIRRQWSGGYTNVTVPCSRIPSYHAHLRVRGRLRAGSLSSSEVSPPLHETV